MGGMKQWITQYIQAQKTAHDSIPVEVVAQLIEKVRAALKEGNDRRVQRAFLEVRESNRAALMLYEGLGLTRSLVREGYYDLPVENAVVMSLDHEGIEKACMEAVRCERSDAGA